MNNDEIRCPHCHKLLMKNNEIKCSRCKNVIDVTSNQYSRFAGFLDKRYNEIEEVKKIISKWPIPLQEEFLRTFEVFQDYLH